MTRSVWAAVVLGTMTLSAQSQQAPPVFRAGIDIVEVDVVVHGRDGAFVSDLSADDFVVEEKGKPQPIEQFYLHVTDVSKWASTPAARGASTTVASLPQVRPSAQRVFVVVFDDEHLTPSGFKRTQAAAETLFSKEFRTGDVGGVVYGGHMVKSRLTTDREELLKAVKDAKPNSNKNMR